MRSFCALLIPIALFVLTSCEKELSYEGGLVPPPPTVIPPPVVPPPAEPTEKEKFAELLIDNKFQLRGFYSDIPIDYIETDGEEKLETDFWRYVPAYLKDDVNTFFENNDVTIQQNEKKRPGLADSLLTRQYTIGTDEEGVYIIFLDYQYSPLEYRVHEFGEDYFILSVPGNDGATLFSRFELIL